ncbi:ankyrin repeat domain-containing protein [Corynebacterium tapiri]|uniref:Ankyrin repeat domain-containing protein n=1 Tax=Corynebacterium tapiri TaxID=1448266 RepID=A0A5C4U2A6_9CORY|nr:ankyrin repeat domain-containing protein [Corynebacterium tapiri]TNL96624.1 ankyrin repeat domain-containing protein [Corynebacterium tapiri]
MTSQPLDSDVQDLVIRLFSMARQGQLALVDYIRAGVDPNLMNEDGNTFIMLAAYNGHAELVSQLAAVGADVDKLNNRGQSPLAGAVFKKEPAVIRALLAAGADADAGHPSANATAEMFGVDLEALA